MRACLCVCPYVYTDRTTTTPLDDDADDATEDARSGNGFTRYDSRTLSLGERDLDRRSPTSVDRLVRGRRDWNATDEWSRLVIRPLSRGSAIDRLGRRDRNATTGHDSSFDPSLSRDRVRINRRIDRAIARARRHSSPNQSRTMSTTISLNTAARARTSFASAPAKKSSRAVARRCAVVADANAATRRQSLALFAVRPRAMARIMANDGIDRARRSRARSR